MALFRLGSFLVQLGRPLAAGNRSSRTIRGKELILPELVVAVVSLVRLRLGAIGIVGSDAERLKGSEVERLVHLRATAARTRLLGDRRLQLGRKRMLLIWRLT